jgi:hypothetical protein
MQRVDRLLFVAATSLSSKSGNPIQELSGDVMMARSLVR